MSRGHALSCVKCPVRTPEEPPDGACGTSEARQPAAAGRAEGRGRRAQGHWPLECVYRHPLELQASPGASSKPRSPNSASGAEHGQSTVQGLSSCGLFQDTMWGRGTRICCQQPPGHGPHLLGHHPRCCLAGALVMPASRSRSCPGFKPLYSHPRHLLQGLSRTQRLNQTRA